MILTSQCN